MKNIPKEFIAYYHKSDRISDLILVHDAAKKHGNCELIVRFNQDFPSLNLYLTSIFQGEFEYIRRVIIETADKCWSDTLFDLETLYPEYSDVIWSWTDDPKAAVMWLEEGKME